MNPDILKILGDYKAISSIQNMVLFLVLRCFLRCENRMLHYRVTLMKVSKIHFLIPDFRQKGILFMSSYLSICNKSSLVV